MGFKKRLFAAGIVLCVLAGELFAGSRAVTQLEETERHSSFFARDTLYFWYTDEALKDFLNSAALDYYEKTGYRIVPEHHSGLEYLEAINEESLRGEHTPDLFITTNDTLEKAYLAGLAGTVREDFTASFPRAAVDAVTYQGRLVGYPFYYETSVLLYNDTYIKDLCKSLVEQEADLEAAQEASALIENASSQEEGVAKLEAMEEDAAGIPDLEEAARSKMKEVIPATIDDILAFADNYDAPAEVEAVFKWDVSDIFYNYFFIGDSMVLGGDAGDTTELIDIDNERSRECLTVYQNLNQFFSIDTREVNYDSVIQDFIDGKVVFTVATTDAVGKIERAKEAGEFQYEYGVTTLPDVGEGLASRGLSVTSAVVVNGYSEKKDVANDFARYLTMDTVDTLYDRTGKVASRKDVPYENVNLNRCMEEYEDSISMPKMIETSNFWVRLEIAFTKIWTGEDVGEVLSGLEEQMAAQLGA